MDTKINFVIIEYTLAKQPT